MIIKSRFFMLLMLAMIAHAGVLAQSPVRLSLKEDEEMAVKNHPQISVAQFNSLAADQVPKGYYPK